MFEVPRQPMIMGEIIAKSFELFGRTWKTYLPLALIAGFISYLTFLATPLTKEAVSQDLILLYAVLFVKQILTGWIYMVFFHNMMSLFRQEQVSLQKSLFALSKGLGRKTGVIIFLFFVLVICEVLILVLMQFPENDFAKLMISLLFICAFINIYLVIRMMMMIPVIATDNCDFVTALARSWAMTRRQLWRIIGVMAVPSLLIPVSMAFLVVVAKAINPVLGTVIQILVVALNCILFSTFMMMMFADCHLRMIQGGKESK